MKKIFLLIASIFFSLVSNPVLAQEIPGIDPESPLVQQLTSDGTIVITQGCAGSTLFIKGANFTGATAVTLNHDAVMSYSVIDDTTITVVLPSTAKVGVLAVITPKGVGESAINFEVVPNTTVGSVTTSICAGDTYVWTANGQSYTTEQIGTTFTSGCNTATLNLSILPVSTTGSVTTLICAGDTYVWPANGQSYTTEQIGTTFTSGCNTATLNLSILPRTTIGSVTQSQDGGSYLWLADGQTYSSSGIYIITTGCNTATLNLTINPGNQDNSGNLDSEDAAPLTITELTTDGSTAIAQGCTSSTVVIKGANFTGATAVTVNDLAVSSFVVNDDTTITVTLPSTATTGLIAVATPRGTASSAGNFAIVASTTDGSVTTSICAGDTYVWPANGESYTTTQIGTIFVSGCNTATLNLTITPAPNAGTNGTLSVTDAPTDAELFAALTGADAGGTWTRPTSGYSGVYTYTVSAISPCTETATATVTVTAATVLPAANTAFNFCVGAKVSALVAATGTGVKAYSAATGGVALLDVALKGTTAKPVAYYLSEPTVSGESVRVRVYVIINALPAKPSALVLTNDNAVAPTTAVTAVGLYAGTNTPFKLTATAAGDGLSYKWTLPNGVVRTDATGATTDASTTSTDGFIYVKFTQTGVATLLVISVQSVNASGCTSVAKLSAALTRLLPAAPGAIVVTDASLPVPAGKLAAAPLKSFAIYMGSPKVLTLTATPSPTATSYIWELPAGVTQLSGGTSNIITVDFAGVTNANTGTYTDTKGILTHVLRIGVKAVNGVGSSIVDNQTKPLTPATESKAKLVTLIAIAPAAPALVLNNPLLEVAPGSKPLAITVVSKLIGQGATYKLTASVSPLASSYSWELPSCVTRVTDVNGSIATTSTTSSEPFIFVKFDVATAPAGSIYFGVKAVNGIGSSDSTTANETKFADIKGSAVASFSLLKLVTVVPAAPALVLNNPFLDVAPGAKPAAITVISNLIGQGAVYRLTAAVSPLATSYSWELPSCVTRVTDVGGSIVDNTLTSIEPYIFVKFNGTNPSTPGLVYFGVKAVNGIGSSNSSIANTEVKVPGKGGSEFSLLKLVVALPAAAKIAGSSKFSVCKDGTETYTITPSPLASSYLITAPIGSIVTAVTGDQGATANILTTSALTFTVKYNELVSPKTAQKTIDIVAVNGVGSSASALFKLLSNGACVSSATRIAAPKASLVTENFNVIAYPNPSSDVFTLEVQSSEQGNVTTNVQVYDMTGRLIEQRQIDSNSVQIGNNYPTGIYNVIVNQAENTKTVRVIKK